MQIERRGFLGAGLGLAATVLAGLPKLAAGASAPATPAGFEPTQPVFSDFEWTEERRKAAAEYREVFGDNGDTISATVKTLQDSIQKHFELAKIEQEYQLELFFEQLIQAGLWMSELEFDEGKEQDFDRELRDVSPCLWLTRSLAKQLLAKLDAQSAVTGKKPTLDEITEHMRQLRQNARRHFQQKFPGYSVWGLIYRIPDLCKKYARETPPISQLYASPLRQFFERPYAWDTQWPPVAIHQEAELWCLAQALWMLIDSRALRVMDPPASKYEDLVEARRRWLVSLAEVSPLLAAMAELHSDWYREFATKTPVDGAFDLRVAEKMRQYPYTTVRQHRAEFPRDWVLTHAELADTARWVAKNFFCPAAEERQHRIDGGRLPEKGRQFSADAEYQLYRLGSFVPAFGHYVVYLLTCSANVRQVQFSDTPAWGGLSMFEIVAGLSLTTDETPVSV